MLHHTEDETDPASSTLDVSSDGDQSDDCVPTDQQAVEELDERSSVTPTVFSSDSDDDSSTLPTLAPAVPQVRHNRQLSDIPEVGTPCSPSDNVPTPSTTSQQDNDSTSTTGSNLLFYGTTVAVAGALIYNKLS